jgi:hypothetical protein
VLVVFTKGLGVPEHFDDVTTAIAPLDGDRRPPDRTGLGGRRSSRLARRRKGGCTPSRQGLNAKPPGSRGRSSVYASSRLRVQDLSQLTP